MSDIIFGLHSIKAALKKKPNAIELLYVQKNRQDQRLHELFDLAKYHNIPIELCETNKLDKLSEGNRHQGVIAILTSENKKAVLSENDLPQLLETFISPCTILILDGVQDPHNLGACIRSADAFDVKLVIVPKDRSCDITPLVRKVASGAAEHILFLKVTNLARSLEIINNAGFWTYGLTEEGTELLYETAFSDKCAVVLGAEGQGLRRLTKEKCDFLVNIPMQGHIESLNVSVACGVVLSEVIRGRFQKQKIHEKK